MQKMGQEEKKKRKKCENTVKQENDETRGKEEAGAGRGLTGRRKR